ACKAQRISRAARKQPLDGISKIGVRRGRAPGGPLEMTLQDRLFNYLTGARDPKATARQFFGQIRHHISLRIEHEADEPMLAAGLASDDAAALGAIGLRLLLLHPLPLPRLLPPWRDPLP